MASRHQADCSVRSDFIALSYSNSLYFKQTQYLAGILHYFDFRAQRLRDFNGILTKYEHDYHSAHRPSDNIQHILSWTAKRETEPEHQWTTKRKDKLLQVEDTRHNHGITLNVQPPSTSGPEQMSITARVAKRVFVLKTSRSS
jgi:hypothetical protein